jgi:PAS domain S-box-containing protein
MSRLPYNRRLPKKRLSLPEFFGRLSIRRKLSLVFGLKALLTMGVCITAIVTNYGVKTLVQEINRAAVDKAEGISSMAESLRELKWRRAEWLLNETQQPPVAGDVVGAARAAKISPDIMDNLREFQRQGIDASRDCVQYSINMGTRHGQPQIVNEGREEMGMLDDIQAKFTALASHLKLGLNPNSSEMAGPQMDQAFDALNDSVESLEAQMKNQDKHLTHEVGHALRRANFIFILFCVVILLLNPVLTFLLSKMISQPLEKLKTAAQQIGQGKLDGVIELPSKDEFGLLAATLNQMRSDLRSTTVSKDYFDCILKSMPNTLIVLRDDFTVRSANRAALDLLECDTFDLAGRPMTEVLKDAGARAVSVLNELKEKGGVNEVEVYYRTRDGRDVPMTFSAATFCDFSGLVAGYICVAQDITERKHSELRLAQANRQLLETSRQAGMAEVATSVLHNVGNVLNSVNVSSTLIIEKVQKSKLGNLGRAVALIEEHQGDLGTFFTEDAKGRQLPDYLSKLAANLLSEHKEIVEEAGQLVKNILHIRDIVAVQQNYARIGGLTEKIDLRELIDDAVRINLGALDRHRVKLEHDYADLPTVVVDKHKVLQILVNLIRNAKYACDDSGREDKRIILRVVQENDRVGISVVDNGVGIPAENLERIFCHGFTTRKEGHGFGLHSGALAAREMGGSLTASSEGLGHGATFTLEFPLAPKEKK